MRFIQRLSFLPVFIVFMTSLYAQDVHYYSSGRQVRGDLK